MAFPKSVFPRQFPIHFPPLTVLSNSGNSLLLEFEGADDDAGILRTYKSAPTNAEYYDLLYHIGDKKYMSWFFSRDFTTPGENAATIELKRIRLLWRGYHDTTTPAVTRGGAGWNALTGNTYPGGRASYNPTTGRYIEFTTPSNCDRIGLLYHVGVGNTGVHLVEINGDATLATSLPTAQDLVTLGTLPDTVLVANGGTLNPTDRIFDNHNAGTAYSSGDWSASYTEIVTGLSAGAHVVRITVTGYQATGATGTNLFFGLVLCNGVNASLSLASGGGYPVFTPVSNIYLASPNGYPVDDVSYSVTPTGASGAEWMGHTGSVKLQDACVFQVDGSPVTLTTNNEVSAGSTAAIIVDAGFRHTEIDAGGTDIANFDVTYTVDKKNGLTITHTTTWLLGGVRGSCFPAMMGLNSATFDRYTTLNFGSAGDLTADDGSSQYSKQTLAGYAWKSGGNVGALMSFPLSTVLNWVYSGSDLHWVDALTSTWNKLYIDVKYPSPYSINDVWSSEVNYRVQYFDDADAVLA